MIRVQLPIGKKYGIRGACEGIPFMRYGSPSVSNSPPGILSGNFVLVR